MHQVFGLHFPGHDMVSEDAPQLVFVLRFEQVFQRPCRKLRESLISGREHREWSRGFQRVDEAGCLQGGCEGFEVSGNGDLDEIRR